MKDWEKYLIVVACLIAICLMIFVYLVGRGMNWWSSIKDSIKVCLGKNKNIEEINRSVVDEKKNVCNNNGQGASSVIVEQPKSLSLREEFKQIDEERAISDAEKERVRAERDTKEKAIIAASDLQDKLDFIAKHPRYQLDQNNRIVLIPVPPPIEVENDDVEVSTNHFRQEIAKIRNEGDQEQQKIKQHYADLNRKIDEEDEEVVSDGSLSESSVDSVLHKIVKK